MPVMHFVTEHYYWSLNWFIVGQFIEVAIIIIIIADSSFEQPNFIEVAS